MQRAPASLQRTTIRVALFVLGGVVVLSVAELTSERFNAFTRDHSLISTFMTEAILLVGVYLVIDQIIERRETRRWGDVMSLGIRAVSTRADGPAGIVRSAVDELDGADASLGALADRLRADDARACSFADELRRSASRLEEAIVQWGPTLVEDPESASLINLLPEIVDSVVPRRTRSRPRRHSGAGQPPTARPSRTACSRSWRTRTSSRDGHRNDRTRRRISWFRRCESDPIARCRPRPRTPRSPRRLPRRA